MAPAAFSITLAVVLFQPAGFAAATGAPPPGRGTMSPPTAAQAAASQEPKTVSGLDFDFFKARVEPIFLKPRGAKGPGAACFTCHAHVTSRLRLQPLSPGSGSWTREQSLQNFEAASRLVVPGDVLKSRLLLHPLAAEAGGDPLHAGGKFWYSQNDPEWQTLATWVRSAPAAAGRTGSETITALDYDVFKASVQPMLLKKRQGLARCVVCHARSATFRLQPRPTDAAGWNEEQSRKNFEAVQQVVVPGDPLASRLLMVPLSHDAGGDPFHPGGKHWMNQQDPEWQMLAQWVRGRPPSGSAR